MLELRNQLKSLLGILNNLNKRFSGELESIKAVVQGQNQQTQVAIAGLVGTQQNFSATLGQIYRL